ncbi:sulfite exporter TauE/SafE family protein [Psychrosphaera sp. G1-22]|uniref:Sulfite exporter TauE/SafE family protein n=1 Tax=Psychrosphaera algicola TaxID=3023714 RepID=A0ABT5F9T0_9GAMM|nr:sulfite exporter TauE/SafE family protein [Psychrosphaera sp. G1-22]MDC2887899.1 sulfite exporter TauE/SafE family protein [Psychrosphaera sp. G1-22]
MNEVITALIMGLTGSVHCLTMCGSLSVALGFSIPKQKTFWLYALFVSLGRVFGYGLIGLLANLLTQSIVVASSGTVFYLSMLSGVLIVGIGLHIANISNIVTKLEKLGTFIDIWLAPLKKN